MSSFKGVDKDMRKVIRAAQDQGFQVRCNTKGHPEFWRDGAKVAVGAGSAGDWRGLRNTVARLRRFGLRWPAD